VTRTQRAGERGATLVELIMVILILGVAAAGIATGFRGATDLTRTQVALASESIDSRRVVGTLTRELRMVTSGTGFTTWTSRDCGFATVRSDSVRFTWSGVAGTPLLAKYNAVVDTVVRDVDSVAFAYQDSVRNAALSTATIDYVSVYVRLNRGGTPLSTRTLVRVRN
jgi:prepilin-type N-terminal cleavage/methylation domain-containing protein